MKYEQKVRSMDDESLTVSAAAREIAAKIGLQEITCQGYIYAKRAGYNSTREYRDELARAQGFRSYAEQKNFEKTKKRHGESYTLEQFKNRKKITLVRQEDLTKYLRTYSAPLNGAGGDMSESGQRVRELDNSNISMANSARSVAKETGLEYQTCLRYISVLRKGITDRIYSDFRLRQRGFIDAPESLEYAQAKLENSKLTLENFRIERAKKSGFKSVEDYIRFLEDRRLFFQKNQGRNTDCKQKLFEYADVEFREPDSIDVMGAELEEPEIDSRDRDTLWTLLKGMLKPKEYAVLYGKYYEERTLKDVAEEIGMCSAGVGMIHAKALRKLRHPCRTKILREFLEKN